MKTPVRIILALVVGLGVTGLSIYLYEVLFHLFLESGASFSTPYTESPFSLFECYRTLTATVTGALTVLLLLMPTRWSARRVSMLMLGTWGFSWGILLLDSAVRSADGGHTFTDQLDWYLLPTLTMALTFAGVLALLLVVHLWLRRQVTAP